MASPRTDSQLLQRRHSYELVPRLFFPKVVSQDTQAVADRSRLLCRQRALERITLILSPAELAQLTNAICQYVESPKLTNLQKTLLQKYVKRSGVVCVDRLLDDHKSIQLSYNDWKLARQHNQVNGLALLEYVYQLQRSLTATQFLLEQPEGTIDGFLTESELGAIVQRAISAATKHQLLNIDAGFESYYELICTRLIALRHDFQSSSAVVSADDLTECPVFLDFLQLVHRDLHGHFIVENNRFDVLTIRNIHRQYLQLDVDKNGMLSADELLDFGKKKAFNPIHLTPTHDLTNAFVTQVFHETKTFPPHGEMDYKTYVDFAVMMADRESLVSLRFFWNVLDFQMQSFLDAFALDFFLRDIVQKIREHEGDGKSASEHIEASVARLRTQVFDLVSPRDSLRITWWDLTNCKLGSLVVRLVTDFVVYREYEACDGRFTVN